MPTTPVLSEAVLKAEYDEIRKRHAGDTLAADRTQAELVGLAFSGGGIRSATFCLGVLQGLKELDLLSSIHYLSTVSGGGYIGAWLSANCVRNPQWLTRGIDWGESIAYLRRYSNYLSPRVGFFSADTWTMGLVWIRNALLVQLTVVMAIACALLVPPVLFEGFKAWPGVGQWRWVSIVLFIAGVVGIAANQLPISSPVDSTREVVRRRTLIQKTFWKWGLTLSALFLVAAYKYASWKGFDPFHAGEQDYLSAVPVALLLVAAGMCLLPVALKIVADVFWREGVKRPTQINYTQAWVQFAIVLPMLATGYFVAAILWGETIASSPDVPHQLAALSSYSQFLGAAWRYWPFPLSVVFSSLWLLSFFSVRSRHDMHGIAAACLAPVVSVAVLHALLCAIMLLLDHWASLGTKDGAWHAFVWTPALVLYAFSLTIVMLIGMMGRQSVEGVREWWSRLGAWLCIYGCAWMVVTLAYGYGPDFTVWLTNLPWSAIGSIVGGWIGTVAAGLFAGNSASTGQTTKRSKSRLLEGVARVAPFVFLAGLLIAVATALRWILGQAPWSDGRNALVLLAICLGVVTLLAARIDINEFSLNAFYRSRLVRCYLGATRPARERHPHRFTGFDDRDDLLLADLASPGEGVGPLHITNCALNLGGSSDLALHTRRSAAFTMSPLYCGSSYRSRDQGGLQEEVGYISTAEYGGTYGQTTFGQAISVSGAAASPNMGYHTSAVVAFLLTLFNARLGWWFPHPRKSPTMLASPRFNLPYLFAELFGGASDTSRFLMISDGGHFDNLGVYELVRRECRVIIVCDAECDPRLEFDSLGKLIRMCDVDFGARIDLDVEAIRPRATPGWSGSRCAAGKITYRSGGTGILIYLKAAMTGHEDTSVLQYKDSHQAFPHETTGDQFYGEDQFESYRRLGLDVARRTFAPVASEPTMVARATQLFDICSPSLGHQGRFTEHSTRLMELWDRLASRKELMALDRELTNGSWPATSADGLRPSFYLCCELIQLMENVYLDLGLEDTWEHVDNSGWKAIFTSWAKSELFGATWAMTKDTYGIRFRYFCKRNFSLPV